MKLRNKKTGKVFDVIVREKSNGDGEYSIIVCNLRALRRGRSIRSILGEYDSLAKLYEDWEDYKPTEPLIKDEKIRKAVRAWAEANEVIESSLTYDNKRIGFYSARADSVIEFATDVDILSKHGYFYTITELCGDEE